MGVTRDHELTLFTGHKQRFIHTHVTRSPPIGIAKLSEVFMNVLLQHARNAIISHIFQLSLYEIAVWKTHICFFL